MQVLTFGDALVLSPPGLGPLVVEEARQLGLRAVHLGQDRRAAVIGLIRPDVGRLRQLRTAEDLLLVVGPLGRRNTAAATARDLDRQALVTTLGRLDTLGPGHARGRRRCVRVVVRLGDERRFRRTELRFAIERQLSALVGSGDDCEELWVVQTGASTLHSAVRVREWSRRSGPRPVERPGALRAAVAAGMVLAAGRPARVLDPCCGTGTIVGEVAATGAMALGGDIDAGAVSAARANTSAPVLGLDARRLPFPDGAFDAVITNLPFGRQHHLQGTAVAWYRKVLAEALRVAELAVLLTPSTRPYRQALGRTKADLVTTHDVTVLGYDAVIWVVRRR